jgi:peroxiredoxin Q/BCP
LSDPSFKTSKKYGVYGKKTFLGRTYMGISRTTFVLDKDKKIIRIFDKVDPAKHPQEVLDFINKK